jgi:hypothetical protein
MQSKEEKHFIHNHFTFLVKYHKDANTDLARIVAFEVKPYRCNILSCFSTYSTVLAILFHLYDCYNKKLSYLLAASVLSMNLMATGGGMLHPLKPVIHTQDTLS